MKTRITVDSNGSNKSLVSVTTIKDTGFESASFVVERSGDNVICWVHHKPTPVKIIIKNMPISIALGKMMIEVIDVLDSPMLSKAFIRDEIAGNYSYGFLTGVLESALDSAGFNCTINY